MAQGDNVAPRTFGYSEFAAENAELIAKGLPPIEQDTYDVDELVDRLVETDPHLARFDHSRLAALVASEIIEQNHDWQRALRGLDPLNWMHFDTKHIAKEHRPDHSPIDEQLYTFDTEFANPDVRDSVGFWVYTDSRNSKRHKFTPVPLQQRTPIERLDQYRKVVERRLDPLVKGCQLNLSFQCLQSIHNQMFAYKQGEFVCVAKCCRHCIELFDVPDAEYHLSRPVGSKELTGRPFGELPGRVITRTDERNTK